MELRDVQAFLKVAQELHFGRAARELGLTQGRVSQLIRNLEREVGGKLFERSSRQVRLTPLGERFRGGVTHGYDTLSRTLSACQLAARQVTSQIRVGYLPTIGSGMVSGMVSVFRQRHPACETMLNALLCRDTLGLPVLFESWEVDIALLWLPADAEGLRDCPELVAGPTLVRIPRGVLVPTDHPLAARSTVSLDDLVGRELLRLPDSLEASLRQAWTPRTTPSGHPLTYTARDVRQMTGRSELPVDDVITLVAQGHGLHLTMTSVLDHRPFPGLVVVPVRDLPPMGVVPIWSAAAENATVRAFVQAATAQSRSVVPQAPRPAARAPRLRKAKRPTSLRAPSPAPSADRPASRG